MSTYLNLSASANASPVVAARKILVFKTNILFRKDVKRLVPVVSQLTGVHRWNVDLDDTDKVLRIEAEELQAQEIISIINKAGYFCEELPD